MIFEAPDKFNRYYFTTEYIRTLRASGLANPTILDLGSNENLLTSFLNQYPVIQADIDRKNTKGTLIQCYGEQLPFRKKAFDIIVCLDVLEHLDEVNRGRMLQEISRITSHTAIFAFPIKHEFSITHEKTLSDIYTYLYSKSNRYLDEHFTFSGVNSDHVEQKLAETFKYIKKLYIFPNHIWLLSSLIDHFLGILPDAQPIRNEVFALINSAPTTCKDETDSYRTFIVASHFPLPVFKGSNLKLPPVKQDTGNIVDAFKKTHTALKNLVNYAEKLESTIKKLELELKSHSTSITGLNKKIHELSTDIKEKNIVFEEHQIEYGKLEQYCFHLEKIITEKQRTVLYLQEKYLNILTEFIDRKN